MQVCLVRSNSSCLPTHTVDTHIHTHLTRSMVRPWYTHYTPHTRPRHIPSQRPHTLPAAPPTWTSRSGCVRPTSRPSTSCRCAIAIDAISVYVYICKCDGLCVTEHPAGAAAVILMPSVIFSRLCMCMCLSAVCLHLTQCRTWLVLHVRTVWEGVRRCGYTQSYHVLLF